MQYVKSFFTNARSIFNQHSDCLLSKINQMSALQSSEASTRSTSTETHIKIKAEVYVPRTSPPYETPLDLRFPLHWDEHATIDPNHVNGSPERAHAEAMWEELHPFGISAQLGVAVGISHYRGGQSPPFFQMALYSEDSGAWKDVYDIVVRSIQKHFGHLAEYAKPIIRYTVYEMDWDEEPDF